MAVVYKISNSIDERVYIGSTIDYSRRHREHINDLKNNKHSNIHLQRFYNKYGLDKLSFDIIEECDDSIVLEKEQILIDSTEKLFNISTDASAPMMGRSHSKETRDGFSKNRMGKNNPMYGVKRPKWIIKKMTEGRLKSIATKREKVLRKINRQLRQEVIIDKNGHSIRCMSQAHAADVIGVKQQSIQKAIKTGKCLCKGWSLEVCSNKIYTDELVKNHLDLFDNSTFFPQPELVEMLKNL